MHFYDFNISYRCILTGYLLQCNMYVNIPKQIILRIMCDSRIIAVWRLYSNIIETNYKMYTFCLSIYMPVTHTHFERKIPSLRHLVRAMCRRRGGCVGAVTALARPTFDPLMREEFPIVDLAFGNLQERFHNVILLPCSQLYDLMGNRALLTSPFYLYLHWPLNFGTALL